MKYILPFLFLYISMVFAEQTDTKLSVKLYSKATKPLATSTKKSSHDLYSGFTVSSDYYDISDYFSPDNSVPYTIQNNKFSMDLKGSIRDIPFKLYTGQISYSKSMSKLKNPASTVQHSALKSSSSKKTGLSPALCKITTSTQDLSTAFCIYPKFNDISCAAEAYCSENGSYAANSSVRIKTGEHTSAVFSLTGGSFFISNNSSVLKKTNAAFHDQWRKAILYEFFFSSPFITMNFSSGLHQSPYNVPFFWFCEEITMSYSYFIIRQYKFAIPTSSKTPASVPLIGINSSIYRTQEITGINPQIKYIIKKGIAEQLMIGSDIYSVWKESSTTTPQDINTLNIKNSIALQNKKLSLRLNADITNICINKGNYTNKNTPSVTKTYSVYSKIHTEYFSTSLKTSYKKYISENKTDTENYTAAISIKNSTPNPISIKTSTSITIKKSEKYTGNGSLAIDLKCSKSLLQKCLKCTIQIPF